jgi:rubrerythrin
MKIEVVKMTEDIRQLERMIEVIARMIPVERRARDVYRKTAASTDSEKRRVLFEHLANQEAEHLTKLMAALRVLQDELEDVKKSE